MCKAPHTAFKLHILGFRSHCMSFNKLQCCYLTGSVKEVVKSSIYTVWPICKSEVSLAPLWLLSDHHSLVLHAESLPAHQFNCGAGFER